MSENRSYTQSYDIAPQQRMPAGHKRNSRRRKLISGKFLLCITGLILCLAILNKTLDLSGHETKTHTDDAGLKASQNHAGTDPAAAVYVNTHEDELTGELQKLLELNAEALDFVTGYPDRDLYMDSPVDLEQELEEGLVPLLMQWDRRWGYNAYGDSIIGLAGCGPLCLDMAYLYLTGDTDITPREMADFACNNGFYTSEGTSWSLWTDGAELLGLNGRELPLDEYRMQQSLDEGGLIVCSMRPGDFTTTGHFILIRGYDENGFYVNDPNRRSTSGRQWDFDTLQYQIKNLWELSLQ